MVQSWTITIQKIIRIEINRSFFKKIDLLVLIKEQKKFKSKLTSDSFKCFPKQFTSDSFNWFPKQFNLVFYTKLVVVLTLKILCFLNVQGLFEIFH